MELGMGVLHWAPSEFWNATAFELSAAAAGLRKSQPKPERTGPGSQAPTRAEVDELKATLGVTN